MFNYSVLKGTVISKGQVEFKNSLYRVLHCAAVTKEKENLLIILPDFMGNGIWTIKVIGLISSVLYIAGNKFLLSKLFLKCCMCHHHGQVGWGLEPPHLLEGIPAYGRGVGTR